MAETHELRLKINAAAAKAGSRDFVFATNQIKKAVSELERTSDGAFKRLSKNAREASKAANIKIKGVDRATIRGVNDYTKAQSLAMKQAASTQKSMTRLGERLRSLASGYTAAKAASESFLQSINRSNAVLARQAQLAGQATPRRTTGGAPAREGAADNQVKMQQRIQRAVDTSRLSVERLTTQLMKLGAFDQLNNVGRAFRAFQRDVAGSAVSSNQLNAASARLNSTLTNAQTSVVTLTTKMRDQKRAASEAASAARMQAESMTRQEAVNFSAAAAMRRAREEAARLTERLRNIGDTAGIAQVSAALASLRSSMAAGVASTSQLRAATDKFSASTSKARVNITQADAAKKRATASARVLAQGSRDAAAAARQVEKEMRSIAGASSAASRSMRDATGSMRGLENAFSGTFQIGSAFRVMLGSLTLGTFTQSVYQAGAALEQFSVAMRVATGSAAGAAREVDFIDGMARNLGTNLRGAREDFAKFAVSANLAGVTTQTTRDIFESVAMAMSVMGRGAEDQRLAFLALEQMLSKNVVSSEELRRQLGERLPGAVNLMAKAVGVSTAELQKMLKAGSLVSSEVLPKFAKEVNKAFGPGFQAATQRASYSIGIFKVEMEKMLETVARSGFMDEIALGLRDITSYLRTDEASDFARKLGSGLGDLTEMFFKLAQAVVTNMTTVAQIMKAVVGGVIVRQLFLMGNAMQMAVRGVSSLNAGFGALGVGSAKSARGITTFAGALSVLGRGLGLVSGVAGLAFTAISLLATDWDGAASSVVSSSSDYEDAMDRMRTSTFSFVDRARQKADEDIFSGLKANIQSAIAAYREVDALRNSLSDNTEVASAAQDVRNSPASGGAARDILKQIADEAESFASFEGTIDAQREKLDKLKESFDKAYQVAPEAFDNLKALDAVIKELGRSVLTASTAETKAGSVVGAELAREAVEAQLALDQLQLRIENISWGVSQGISNIIAAFTALAGTGQTSLNAPLQSLVKLQDEFTGSREDVEKLQGILGKLDFSELSYAEDMATSLSDSIDLLAQRYDEHDAAASAATQRVLDNGDAMSSAAAQTAGLTNEVSALSAALASIPGIQLNMQNTVAGVMSGLKERVRLAEITDQSTNRIERAMGSGTIGTAVGKLQADYKEAESKLSGIDPRMPGYSVLKDRVEATRSELKRGTAEIRSGLKDAITAEQAQRELFTNQNKAARKASGGGGSKGRKGKLSEEQKVIKSLQDDIDKRRISLENEERVLRLLASGQTRYRESAELMAEAMRLNNGVLDEGTRSRIAMMDAQKRLNDQLTEAANNPLQDWMDGVQTMEGAMKDMQASLAEGLSETLAGVFKNGELDFSNLVDNMLGQLATFASDNIVKSLFSGTGLGNIFGQGQGGGGESLQHATSVQSAIVTGAQVHANAISTAMRTGAAIGGQRISGAMNTGAIQTGARIQTAGVASATTMATSVGVAGMTGATQMRSGIMQGSAQGAQMMRAATSGGGGGGLGSIFGGGNWLMAGVGLLGGLLGGGGSSGSSSTPKHEEVIKTSTYYGPTDIPSYAEGTANTSGEKLARLHDNEAVIPLTRGRKVPIDMKNSNSPSMHFSQNVTVNVEGGTEGDDINSANNIAQTVSTQLEQMVEEKIIEHTRYGGLLNLRGGS